jgi:hypothetical protein
LIEALPQLEGRLVTCHCKLREQCHVDKLVAAFEDLKADQLDSAYQGLVKNTIISERTENIDQLKEKTRVALDNFGPVKGYEIVESLDVGSSLIRFTCVSLNADVPMRWRFYFYRSGSQWKIIDLRVDDGIADLFEEVSSRRKK